MLRIKLRYDDVEAMIQRFAPNVGKTGLFLPTKSLQPVGSEIKFELRLANDQPVLVGLGRVKAAREPDPENPRATFGISVELMRVTRESRDLILKILERRRQLGLQDTGIPMPADIDAARRADFLDSGVRDYASGAVPQLVSATESAPAVSEPLPFTAPRRQSGPIAVAKLSVVAPLAPEAPRKKRVPIAELIASASGPIVASFTTDSLDDDIDVSAVLARARSLANGGSNDLDSELDALLEAAAAPLEIGIEAASAELARQLGGAAVRRDRSARWAPPPPTTTEDAGDAAAKVEPARSSVALEAIEARSEAKVEAKVEVPVEAKAEVPVEAKADVKAEVPVEAKAEVEAEVPVEAKAEVKAEARAEAKAEAKAEVGADPPDEDDDELDEPTPVAAIEPLFARADIAATLSDDDPPRRASTGKLIHDGADASEFEDEEGAHEVLPEQIHDEVHRLDEEDFEEVEHTQVGAQPADANVFDPIGSGAFDQHALATMPATAGEPVGLADRLDAQLAEAENEDMGLGGELAHAGFSRDGFAAEGSAGYGAAAYPGGDPDGLVTGVEDEEIEEIDDFEILAEADAEDADLLAVGAEQELSGGYAARAFAHHAPETLTPDPETLTPDPERWTPAPEVLTPDPERRTPAPEVLTPDPELRMRETPDFETPDPETLAPDPAHRRRGHETPDMDLQTPDPETLDPDEQQTVAGDAHGFELELPPARPSFLSRLELDDDSGFHAPLAGSQFDEPVRDPGAAARERSAGHALRGFEDSDHGQRRGHGGDEYGDRRDLDGDFNAPGTYTPVPPDPYAPERADSVGEHSYTFAGDLSADELDEPHGNYAPPPSGGFVPPDAFDQSDVISIRPDVSASRPHKQPKLDADGLPDLESALEALDVDLDDLGGMHGGRRGPTVRRGGRTSDVPTARGGGRVVNDPRYLATSPTEDAGARNVRQTGGRAVVAPLAAARPPARPTPKPWDLVDPVDEPKRAVTDDGIVIDFDDDD